jgi:hypothetical protein
MYILQHKPEKFYYYRSKLLKEVGESVRRKLLLVR